MSIQTTLNSWAPSVLSVTRIYVSLALLQHGTAKVLGFPAAPQFANVQIGSLSWTAGVIELVGGVLLVLGLFTRPVAFIICGFAAAAYFMGHAAKSFYPIINGGELASVYCFIFLYFIFAGPGPLSLDAIMRGKR